MSRYYKGNGLCGPTHYVCTTKRDTPGPKYALPSLTGYFGHDFEAQKPKAPAYSLRRRFVSDMIESSPGPAAYRPKDRQTRTGSDGTPAYSLSDRHRDAEQKLTPGPGAYAPEKHFYPQSRSAPIYSMGRRLKPKTSDSHYKPAPNAYTLPSRIGTVHPDLKKAPTHFMTFRDKRGGFQFDYGATPGPAAYMASKQNIIKTAAPEYTMRPKCEQPGDKTIKPGPAAHRHEDCPHTAYSRKKGAPAYSFGMKHHEYAVSPIFTDCEAICQPQEC